MTTHRSFVRSVALGAVLAGSATVFAAPHAATSKADDDAVDVSDFKARLRVFTDGQNHYVMLVPSEITGANFFYGSKSDVYQQRSLGGGRTGDEAFNRDFWDPRQSERLAAEFRLRDKKYTLTCEKREIDFKMLPEAEPKAIIDGERFHRPSWKHQSYWLARDDRGNYIYVDRLREPPGNTAFRLWTGPKGAMKPIKMTNIVSDGKGDIFTTKNGQLRLVSNTSDGKWIRDGKTEVLRVISIEDDHVLVYKDLGVYAGERLGTPCDDL